MDKDTSKLLAAVNLALPTAGHQTMPMTCQTLIDLSRMAAPTRCVARK